MQAESLLCRVGIEEENWPLFVGDYDFKINRSRFYI